MRLLTLFLLLPQLSWAAAISADLRGRYVGENFRGEPCFVYVLEGMFGSTEIASSVSPHRFTAKSEIDPGVNASIQMGSGLSNMYRTAILETDKWGLPSAFLLNSRNADGFYPECSNLQPDFDRSQVASLCPLVFFSR